MQRASGGMSISFQHDQLMTFHNPELLGARYVAGEQQTPISCHEPAEGQHEAERCQCIPPSCYYSILKDSI
jgi:hypothetical protein